VRDIRPEGDFVVQGDFTVNEAPQEKFVPFDRMGLDDLRANLEHHNQLARDERGRFNGISFKLLGVALLVGTVLAIWYFIAGRLDSAMFLVGLVGVGMPVFLAINNGEQQSEFELRQLNTVRYISHPIRERTTR
jgi:hypothetical protein